MTHQVSTHSDPPVQRDAERIECIVEIIDRVLVPYHRAEVRGLERVPEEGAIFVGNHNGGFLTSPRPEGRGFLGIAPQGFLLRPGHPVQRDDLC